MGETAAQWTVRRDRGLSAAESIEFELWLAADPRHRAAMKRAGGAWARLRERGGGPGRSRRICHAPGPLTSPATGAAP